MHVDVITEPSRLDELRANWDQLYDSDPEAQFFVSWSWLSRYLRIYDGIWFILAARRGGPGSAYVGLMPLRLRTRMNARTGHFFNEINMAGNYAADYTGAVCAPDQALQSMQAFGRHLRDMAWTRMHLENIRMSDERLLAFLGQLPRETLALSQFSRLNHADNVDNCRCFAASLPDSFDSYLDDVLSANTRQKLRRFMRKVASGELRITQADASTLDRDIDTILEFWRTRWGARKGDRIQSLLRHNRIVLRNCFEAEALFMPVLWQGDRPLGALACFVDPVKKTMLFFMAGRNETVTSLPVGLILHGHSIRIAIERGFQCYDFLRGDEPYKLAFGVTENRIRCAMVYTRDGRNNGDRLDPRSLDVVLAEVTRIHARGELARAENGYRQILRTDPRYGRALYGMGQLVSAKGDHRQARSLFETLAEITPNASKVWFRLGAELHALNDHEQAAEAFRRALALNEKFAAAKLALGKSLAALDRAEEAEATLSDLRRSLENTPRAEKLLVKTNAAPMHLKQEARPSYIRLIPQRKRTTSLVSPAL